MTETVKRRRRWPWGVFATILLLIVGAVGWAFRPLNATEKALIGRWRMTDAAVDGAAESRPDRRCQLRGFPAGTWRTSGTRLFIRFPLPLNDLAGRPWSQRVGRYLEALLSEASSEVTWDGPDKFGWGGNEFVRIPAVAPDR